ncbi:MAG: ABC transporter permease [Chitinophagales bacterium]
MENRSTALEEEKKPGFIDGLLNRTRTFLDQTGKVSVFAGQAIKEALWPPYEFLELMRQCYFVGNLSLPLVAITALIMGLVFTLQSHPTLAKFGAESWLPAMVSVAMLREIAPVITALICAGKVGSGMGAELASMRVTEQIDAMEVAGNKPMKYVVATRVLAVTIMVPMLVIFADAISILGSFIGVSFSDHTSFTLFFNHVFNAVDFIDFLPAVIKSFFFGFAIGIISCYKGYTSNSGTAGVGVAANESVVVASLSIFIIDMIAVQVTNFFM